MPASGLRRFVTWWQRALMTLHRWAGVGLCLLLLLWFASGAVMIFEGYPVWTPREALALAESVPMSDAAEPATLLGSTLHAADPILVGREGRPLYLLHDGKQQHALWADTGRPFVALHADEARRLAAARFAAPLAQWRGRLLKANQWTLSSRLHAAFPLHHVALNDADGTEVYLAERSGEVVQASTRHERLLAWFGAIPHWIYPTLLRQHAEAWRLAVILLACAGLVVCVSGLFNGLRVLKRRGLWWRSPYRKSAVHWHHRLGLGFGVLASTWLLSGALSLNPMRWSPGHAARPGLQQAMQGGHRDLKRFDRPWTEAVQACRGVMQVRELQLRQVSGTPYYICRDGQGDTRVLRASASEPETAPQKRFSPERVRELARGLHPTAGIAEMVWMQTPDEYHYANHYRPELRLPYVRVRYDDAEQTVAYLDPHVGALLKWHTRRSRLERWLYHGLHSLDFPWLYARETLWRSVMLLVMAAGVALSLSGSWLAWRYGRRLRRRTTRARKQVLLC